MPAPSPPGLKSSIEYFAMSVGIGRTLPGHLVSLYFSRIGRGRGMKGVELYGRVRYAVRIEGLSERAAARRFGIDPRKQAQIKSIPLRQMK